MKKPINILCTRPLNEGVVRQALKHNINIQSFSFIDTIVTIGEEVAGIIEKAAAQQWPVIITSMNAADAVISQLAKTSQTPPWCIYTMSGATKTIIKEYWPTNENIVWADDAASLATKIIAGKHSAAYFFCGNIRRDELPNQLTAAGVKVYEAVVYKTIFTPKHIEQHFDGVVFFSPSAVESFFSKNSVAAETILFAIGNTTGATIRQYTQNPVIISDHPAKYQLVDKVIEYFNLPNEMQ